jgi:predicted site-specific integrase-resolvase
MFNNSAATYTLTEEQFANAVGISIAFLRELRRQGRVPHVRINRRVLYLKTDAERFLEQHRNAVAEVA